MLGAEINWNQAHKEPYKFTEQDSSFEDIQRLRHEIHACMEALESMALLSDRSSMVSIKKVSRTVFRVSRHP